MAPVRTVGGELHSPPQKRLREVERWRLVSVAGLRAAMNRVGIRSLKGTEAQDESCAYGSLESLRVNQPPSHSADFVGEIQGIYCLIAMDGL